MVLIERFKWCRIAIDDHLFGHSSTPFAPERTHGPFDREERVRKKIVEFERVAHCGGSDVPGFEPRLFLLSGAVPIFPPSSASQSHA